MLLQDSDKASSSSPYCTNVSSELLSWQWNLSKKRNSLASPKSRWLFDWYVSRTAVQFGIITPGRNPFIRCVLPLAFSDELIMNCILALAGAELGEEIGAATVSTTWKHYTLVLRDLQASMSQGMQDHKNKRFHLLLVTLFLGLIEVCYDSIPPSCPICSIANTLQNISGNSQTFPHHLRASRQLVLDIISSPSEHASEENRDLWGFLLEMYSYRALVASITPLGASDPQQQIPVDPFLDSLWKLSQYKTFGFQFACGHSIFQFIPEVSRITNQRMIEEKWGTLSPETHARYKSLVLRIRLWNPTVLPDEIVLNNQRLAAATIYQKSLLIYLHSYFLDPILNDSGTFSEMELCTNTALPLLISLSRSQVASIMMWPTLMVCSCLRQEDQHKLVRQGISEVDFNSKAIEQCAKLLDALWEDSDPQSYGPRGLDYIMKKKGWSICMS